MGSHLNKTGLQYYADKMVLGENRRVNGRPLPTVLSEIDSKLDTMKTLFESEYGTPLTMDVPNIINTFSPGVGINIDKKNDFENGYTDFKVEGNTLVNLVKTKFPIRVNKEGAYDISLLRPLKRNTTYTIVGVVDYISRTDIDYWFGRINYDEGYTNVSEERTVGNGCYIGKVTTKDRDFKSTWICYMGSSFKEGDYVEYKDYMIIEGDYTDKPPSFFKGIKSVGEDNSLTIQSKSKNIFNHEKPSDYVCTYSSGYPMEQSQLLSSLDGNRYKLLDKGFYYRTSDNTNNSGVGYYIKCAKNTDYRFMCDVWYNGSFAIKCQGVMANEVPIKKSINKSRWMFNLDDYSKNKINVTFNSKEYDYLFFYFGGSWVSNAQTYKEARFTNIILTSDTTTSEWELIEEDNTKLQLIQPLRKLPNGVADSIEKIGGHYKIIRRTGQITLTGLENYSVVNDFYYEGTTLFSLGISHLGKKSGSNHQICDLFECGQYNSPYERVSSWDGNGNNFLIRVNNDKATTIADFKTWLKANNLTIAYELQNYITEDIDSATLRCWKNGIIMINDNLPATTSHTIALNKTAQIQKNIKELSDLKARVEDLTILYDSIALEQTYQNKLLNHDIRTEYNL